MNKIIVIGSGNEIRLKVGRLVIEGRDINNKITIEDIEELKENHLVPIKPLKTISYEKTPHLNRKQRRERERRNKKGKL